MRACLPLTLALPILVTIVGPATSFSADQASLFVFVNDWDEPIEFPPVAAESIVKALAMLGYHAVPETTDNPSVISILRDHLEQALIPPGTTIQQVEDTTWSIIKACFSNNPPDDCGSKAE